MRKLFFVSFIVLLLTGCASLSYDVQSVCEVTDLYNYVVKWEVSPMMDGMVKIYSSSNPDHFDLSDPVAEESINKGRADIVVKGTLSRRFFMLVFDDELATVVGVRSQKFSTIQNFRDLGGYKTIDGRSLRWGKIYRSGNLDSLNLINAKRIKRMNVESLVDLRMHPTHQLNSNTGINHYYNFPLCTQRKDPLPLIIEQRFKRGDAIIFMQDVCSEMVLHNKESFHALFELLRSKKNYPVILECRYGNLQTSLATALILSALDVPEQTILDDYLLSNQYFNMRSIAQIAYQLPTEAQDAITSMMVSDERYLLAALNQIKIRYGSVSEFLKQEFGVDEDFKEDLRKILLH